MKNLALFCKGQVGFVIGTSGLILLTDMETSSVIVNHLCLSFGYISCLINPSITVKL